MKRSKITVAMVAVVMVSLFMLVGSASAVVYDGLAAGSVLHDGDRELTNLTFVGSSTVMTGADFMRYNDGYLFRPDHQTSHVKNRLYGWNDVQPRDMAPGQNKYAFNPDRADKATKYVNESTSGGTLSEVFGSFKGEPNDYKNMSYILDGEKSKKTYYVDLYFDGFSLSGDDDKTSIEVALLERGGNSKMKVYGILAGDTSDPDTAIYKDYTPKLTKDSVLVGYKSKTFNPLWKLDTLEIGGAQAVRGYGISISNDWTNLVGLRIASEGCAFEGPYLVGVGVVPEPATMTLLGLGGVMTLIHRKRRAC